LQDCVASLTRPVRELKGFTRLALQPGETKQVSFTLGAAEMSFYDRSGKQVVEPGEFKVWIGGDSRAELETKFVVKSQ
jgi:beta-glucosidase